MSMKKHIDAKRISLFLVSLVFGIAPHFAWLGFADYGLLKTSFVLVCAAVWWGAAFPNFTFRNLQWRYAWIIAAVGYLVVTQFWAVDPWAGLGKLSQWGLLIGFGWGAASRIGGDVRLLKPVYGVLVVSALLSAVLALFQLFGGLDWPDQVRAPAATFSNRNLLMHWLLVAWPAGWILLISTSRVWWRIFWTVPLLVIPCLVILVGSKAGILALILEGIVLLGLLHGSALAFGRFLRWAFLLVIIGVVSVLFWVFGAQHMTDKGEAFWRSHWTESVVSRTTAWQGAFDLLVDHPMGVGFGQFERAFPPYERNRDGWSPGLNRRQGHLHNDWLQLLVEGGLLTVPFILWGSCQLLRRIRKQFSETSRDDDPFILAALSTVVGVVWLGCVSFPLQNGLILFAFSFFLGLLACKSSCERCRYNCLPNWKRLMGIALIAMPVVAFQGRQIAADRLFYKQAQAFYSGDTAASIEQGTRLMRIWPRHAMGADLLGRAAIQTRDFPQGQAVFAALRRSWPNDPGYLYHEALALAGTGQSAAAVERLTPLVEQYPSEAQLQYFYGTQLFASAYYNASYVAFHTAARLEPTNWLYAHNVGVAAERAGWRELAIEAYTYALKLDPERSISRQRLKALEADPLPR
jgi:O-antigen ligase